MKKFSITLVVSLISCLLFAQENIDLSAIEKIKKEGLENSAVEEIAFKVLDLAGPRLTNSPGYHRATGIVIDQLEEWKLDNIQKQAWGDFGKGWQVEKSYIAMVEPYYMPFIAVPRAWTGSTDGLITQKIIVPQIETSEDLLKYQGKLKGAIVVRPPSQFALDYKGDTSPTFEADAERFSEEDLIEMQEPLGESTWWSPEKMTQLAILRKMNQEIDSFFRAEEVALVLKGAVGKHGTLFTGSRRKGRLVETSKEVAELDLAPEYTNMLVRFAEHGTDVTLEAEVQTTFYEEDLKGYNVLAEIPGTDKKLKKELVMLGAHLDSWHGATGATDNGAGTIVMMEAIRILKATGLTPKRTIRLGLWGGEEQGLHGSKNYVKNNFGDSETMTLLPDHEKLSAYYNIDNGTGRIRGIYLQGNEAAAPIFEEWFKPLDDLIDNTTITIRNTGGTDHLAFDGVGLPGFQFIQDKIEYNTRTHHTNMDNYDRLVIDDLKQMAVVVASFVYMTAQREEKIPRKATAEVESN